MNQTRPGSGAPAAVLAGSLAVFPLLDVLGLLARTRHAGELQVVADGVEARLWVEGGDLLDHAATAADRLFELACLDDAWFAASSVLPPGRVEHAERVALEPLIERVAPHVAEWQSLMKALPFGAVARMSPVMPGSEAQIRSDQWHILSLIGTGRAVHEVVDVSDGRPLETLRVIHELAQKELIVVELPPAEHRRRTHPAGSTSRPKRAARPGDASEGGGVPPGRADTSEPAGASGLSVSATAHAAAPAPAAPRAAAEPAPAAARGAAEPAPAAAEPAPAGPVPPGEPEGPEPDPAAPGSAAQGGGQQATPERAGRELGTTTPGEAVPVVAARTTTPLTARRAGAVRTPVAERAPAPEPGSTPEPREQSRRGPSVEEGTDPAEGRPVGLGRRASHRSAPLPRHPGHHAVGAYMPPPVAPGFWPATDPAGTAPGRGEAVGGASSTDAPASDSPAADTPVGSPTSPVRPGQPS